MPEIFKDLDLTTVHYNLEKDRDLIAIKTAADQVDQVGRLLLWVITAHLWIGSSIEIHILFQSMLQNIELELQNWIFFIGHWTIGIYISQPFMWSLNFQKLGSIAGNCFHFLFYRRINWSDTIHEDYLLAVCCSEQWLHSGHFSAGSSTERNPHLLPAETADDHYDQIAVSLDLYRFVQNYLRRFNIALSFCRTLVDRVINWKMEENRSDQCQTCSHLLAGYCSEQLLHTCRPGLSI